MRECSEDQGGKSTSDGGSTLPVRRVAGTPTIQDMSIELYKAMKDVGMYIAHTCPEAQGQA